MEGKPETPAGQARQEFSQPSLRAAHEEVPAFVRSLRLQEGVGPLALEFAILTATRTSGTLGPKWSEIDLEKKVWTIPKERMKAGEEHDVPIRPGR
jgi:integrase